MAEFDFNKILASATDNDKQQAAMETIRDNFKLHPELASAPQTSILTLAMFLINHGATDGMKDIKTLNETLGGNFPMGDMVLLAALACAMNAMMTMMMDKQPMETITCMMEGTELGPELLQRIKAFGGAGLGEIKTSGNSSSVKFNRKDFKND